MRRRYIDFISAYCDRWCERCGFTERCSAFAIQSALAMCDGDHDAAFELAIGRPRVPGRQPQKSLGERMADALGDDEPSAQELAEIGREIDERQRRVAAHPLAQASLDYAVAGHRWLTRRGDDVTKHADAAVRNAAEIVCWDVGLIHAKINRALDGRDEYPDGAPFDTSPVQSDWNGSAKVALISIERSGRAWRIVAAAMQDEAALVLADRVAALEAGMRREFPEAMAFKRPGFDAGDGST